jgi:putative tricarboxylic transport membrane protein
MTTPSPASGAAQPHEPAADSQPTAATPHSPGAGAPRPGWRDRLRGHSELGVSVLLLAVGVLVLTDTLTMETLANQRGPVGPRTVPLVVGVALLVVAVVLAVDVLRGGRGEAESGEDVDLDEPGDWRTVALLAGIFLACAALIEPLGFPVTGALLFWGSAYALGSRNVTRDPFIAAVLSLATFAAFNTLLGVPLPGGPLMGVL